MNAVKNIKKMVRDGVDLMAIEGPAAEPQNVDYIGFAKGNKC